MKKILFLFALLLIVVAGLYFLKDYIITGETLPFSTKNSIVTIRNHSFNVFMATSQKEQEIGLSETKTLSSDQGMIFIFEKPDYYAFWMKNMKFAIDIIYINEDKITTIKSNVQPSKNDTANLTIYIPEKPSDKVLEIQAGLSEEYGFQSGDKVTYENLGN